MEIRARYTLIGLFTLSAIAATFGFVYWLNHAGGLGKRAIYQARFENSVSGLLKGSAVLFNGIRVGEVIDLHLAAEKPQQVTAIVAVEQQTPVRADTKVGIEFQGLMGSPVIALTGGLPTASQLVSINEEPPLLLADPGAGQNVTESARSVLRHIDTVVTENSEPLRSLIANINTFSNALARNVDRVDGILAGVERMTGGGAKNAQKHVFDLVAPQTFPQLAKVPEGQLVIPEPEILGNLFNDDIVVRNEAGARDGAFAGKWPDTLSRVLHSRIIQSFENANYLKAIGRQTDGLVANYQLLLDVRSFQVVTSQSPVADFTVSAKIVGDNGQILGAKIFRATVPAIISDESSVAAALNAAFSKAATELVIWTCNTI